SITTRSVVVDGQSHLAASRSALVFENKGTAVTFGKLPAEHETDSRASSLGCEKWDKQVGGVRESRTVIKDRKLQSRSLVRPLNHNFAAAFEHSVSGVADQIDQQLLKLVSIRGKC